MTEQEVRIPIPSTSLTIHGVLRGNFSDLLIIIAPGLGGWMHETLLYNAARYFDRQGIATLRVSFYGDDKDQRDSVDCDASTHGEDFDILTKYAKSKGSHKVCVIGHSYSGMGILYSKEQEFDTAVLWDPSHTDSYDTLESRINLNNDFTLIKDLDAYVSTLGAGYVIGKKVFENNSPGSTEIARKFRVPTLVVNCSYSKDMQKYGKAYIDAIQANASHAVIPNSTHPFVEDGAMEKLFTVTADWLAGTNWF